MNSLFGKWRQPKLQPVRVATMRIPKLHLKALRDDDVFLVSYPRSGNTWMRHLVYELLLAEHPEAAAPADINHLIPDLHHHPPGHSAQARFHIPVRLIKTHNTQELGGRQMIYIYREPADALISYYHYHQREEHNRARATNGPDHFCRQMAPGWVEHAAFALAAWESDPSRVSILSYANLHADTAAALERVARFCGYPTHCETLRQSVERNAFDRLQRRAGDAAEKPNERFFRRGVQGSAHEELPVETLTALSAVTSDVWQRLERTTTSARA